MARKLIVTKEKIYLRRADHWQEHYKRREMARAIMQSGFSPRVMLSRLYMDLPAPALDVDGDFLQMAFDDRRKMGMVALTYGRLPSDLLCRWYWSPEAWQEFVRAFQALPDIFEDYYYTFDKATDRVWLAAVSTARRGRRAVDKPVDNKGTSRRAKVQVTEFSPVFSE